jgi:BirA family transcriptional regulator, biotin operon repressor / biotin---[acetyl-CoA-carboxylase] ligase
MTPEGSAVPGWEGRTREEWAGWLGIPGLELHPELPSTNDRARDLAREGAPPWTAVVAGSQTAGRGRGGKPWVSPAGAGLWMSVLLPQGAGKASGPVPLLVGLAGARALESLVPKTPKGSAPLRVRLKWPNDLLISGKKVAGILCEGSGSGSGNPAPLVAGIGINLRRPTPEVPPGLEEAGFVEDLGVDIGAPEVARGVIREMRGLMDPMPPGLGADVREAWRRRDHLVGRSVSCEAGPRGVALGIAPDGALLVRTKEGKVVPVRAGSVRTDEPTVHAAPRDRGEEE